MGGQAKQLGVLTSFKQFLKTLATLVPGAWVRETPKQTTSYVSKPGKAQYIALDDLLADEQRRHGWVHAISDFQAAVAHTSND